MKNEGLGRGSYGDNKFEGLKAEKIRGRITPLVRIEKKTAISGVSRLRLFSSSGSNGRECTGS